MVTGNLLENLKKITKTAVVAQGGIRALDEGEKLLEDKTCDIYGMCQALIADPQLVTKTMNKKKIRYLNVWLMKKLVLVTVVDYLMHKTLTFDCITPARWVPENYKKRVNPMNADKWNKIISTMAKQKS